MLIFIIEMIDPSSFAPLWVSDLKIWETIITIMEHDKQFWLYTIRIFGL